MSAVLFVFAWLLCGMLGGALCVAWWPGRDVPTGPFVFTVIIGPCGIIVGLILLLFVGRRGI